MRTPWWTSYRSLRPRRIAIVSSTDGSPTYTCWNRRSSAGSFSTYLRYSSSVVAPIMRNSPRASIGLIMLPASTAPSAPPAPTMVCSSSTNVTTSPSESTISLRTDLSRAPPPPLPPPLTTRPPPPGALRTGDHPADRERDGAFVAPAPRHVPPHDATGQPFGDRGLADA